MKFRSRCWMIVPLCRTYFSYWFSCSDFTCKTGTLRQPLNLSLLNPHFSWHTHKEDFPTKELTAFHCNYNSRASRNAFSCDTVLNCPRYINEIRSVTHHNPKSFPPKPRNGTSNPSHSVTRSPKHTHTQNLKVVSECLLKRAIWLAEPTWVAGNF